MWWLPLFVASVSALGPVKDYRVASWETLDSWPFNHQKAASVALLGVATNVISSVSSVSTVSAAVPDSVPTVVLGSTVQALWTDSSNSIYYVNATIDDNNSGYSQVFPLLIDTGSGISWIYNTSCTLSACLNAPKFEDSGSIYTTSSFSLTYTGQTINGSLVDTLHNNLTYSFPDGLALANYLFGLATSAPLFFNDYNVSGIIGIPSKFDESVPTNFIAQLKATGSIDTRKFGLVLGGSANSNSSFGGLLLFGDAASNNSKTLATSDLAYCSLDDNSHGYWLVTVSELNVVDSDDNPHALSSFNSSRQAIIDTGTTGLSLPLADADALHTALFGSTLVSDNNGNYAFLCNATGEMDFIIGGHNFTIPVDNIRGSAYQNSVLSGYCASKVQGSTSSTFWVLGASFLKSFYTIFDLDNLKIGFAPCVESFATAAANEAPKMSLTTLATSTTSMASSASNSTSTSHNNAALNAVGPFASLSSVVLALFCMLY
ncbi:CIC11C00000004861 [Sungouiella intermedia]|uniref:CIC11C00000004861 n=1 Tax=Sungouiella intermedia TaxID=45354 RepID=A0A1L0FXH7_9ASCO|nr:CIC11C00000004861 [[Candida] intermedia]